MKDWYAASQGEFAQISAITAAVRASRPPTGSLRRRSLRNRVSPGSGSGSMRRSTDTGVALRRIRCPQACRGPAPALAGQASGVRTTRSERPGPL